MPFETSRVQRAAIAAAALAVGALALAACGGKSSSASSTPAAGSTPTTTGSTSTNPRGAFAAYTTCLKQNGVTLPNFGRRPNGNGGAPPANGTPPTNGRGFGGGRGFGAGLSPAQRKKFQTAQTACAKYRPAGRGGGFFGGGGGANNQAFAAYRNCLTLHGLTFARPTAGGQRPNRGVTSAKARAALAACASLRPDGFGRRPPASGSG